MINRPYIHTYIWLFLYKKKKINLRQNWGFLNQNKQTEQNRLHLWVLSIKIKVLGVNGCQSSSNQPYRQLLKLYGSSRISLLNESTSSAPHRGEGSRKDVGKYMRSWKLWFARFCFFLAHKKKGPTRTLPLPSLPHSEPTHPVFSIPSVLVTPGRTAFICKGNSDWQKLLYSSYSGVWVLNEWRHIWKEKGPANSRAETVMLMLKLNAHL